MPTPNGFPRRNVRLSVQREIPFPLCQADQLRATGARIVVTSCHNCVDGLFDLIKHYQLDIQVKLLVNLVASALVVPERPARS
jgi:hypothetical protein